MASTDYVPVAYPRRWMPEDITLKTWEEIEPWYRGLLDRPVTSPRSWKTGLRRRRAERASGRGGGRYIAMTCQTTIRSVRRRTWRLSARSSRT